MSELFHVQSSRWYAIADGHLTALYSEIKAFVKAVLSHITKDSRILAELWEITKLSLQESKHAADEELSKLYQDEKQQPITYNHYYTDNVQNARQQSTRNLIKKATTEASADDWNGKLHISNNAVDAEKLLASLQKRIIVDRGTFIENEYFRVRIGVEISKTDCRIGGNNSHVALAAKDCRTGVARI